MSGCANCGCGGGTCEDTLASHCTSYWKFDDGAGSTFADTVGIYDFSQGTYSEAVGTGSGKVSGCIAFADQCSIDTLQYLQAGTPNLSGTTKLAVMLWVDDFGQTYGGECDGDGGDFWVVNQLGTSDSGWAFNILQNQTAEIRIGNSGSWGVGSITDSGTYRNNTYHHYAILYDGSQSGNSNRLKFYKNGSLQTLSFSGTVPSSIGSTDQNLIVGGYLLEYSDVLDRQFFGNIDEMAYRHGDVFTTDDIACHYNGGSGTTI